MVVVWGFTVQFFQLFCVFLNLHNVGGKSGLAFCLPSLVFFFYNQLHHETNLSSQQSQTWHQLQLRHPWFPWSYNLTHSTWSLGKFLITTEYWIQSNTRGWWPIMLIFSCQDAFIHTFINWTNIYWYYIIYIEDVINSSYYVLGTKISIRNK